MSAEIDALGVVGVNSGYEDATNARFGPRTLKLVSQSGKTSNPGG